MLSRRFSPIKRQVRLGLEALEDRLVPAVITVNTTADVPLNQLQPGQVTLRDAIQIANTNGETSNTIDLAVAGTYLLSLVGTPGEVDNQAGELAVFTNATANQSGLNLTIQNTSGGNVVLNGNNASRVLDINPNDIIPSNNVVLGAVTINGVTIENGLAQPGDNAGSSGGGIRDQGPVDLTLNNDLVTNNTAQGDGGGISMENAASTTWKLTLNNMIVSHNSAGDAGGGIDEDGGGTVNVTNSTIESNNCPNQGGGVWLDAINGSTANLNVNNSLVDQNSSGMLGGGIGNSGNGAVTIANSTIQSNFTVGDGGGFADQGTTGTLAVQNCLFLDNSADQNGGGIQEDGATTISNSEIKGNSADINNVPTATIGGVFMPTGRGGGLFINGGSLTLNASTIADNTAKSNGGGIDLAASTLSTITNSTIVGNRALNNAFGSAGGGIEDPGPVPLTLQNDTITNNFAASGSGLFINQNTQLTIQNTVIAQNVASVGGADLVDAGSFPISGSGNLIGIGNGSVIFFSGNSQQGTTANPLNPMLAALGNNGGSVAGSTGHQMVVETEAELPGSTAIQKGAAVGTAFDERGVTRIGTPDVGAFQFANVALQVAFNAPTTLGLNATKAIQITVTNASGAALPSDGTLLTVTSSGGLNIGSPQTFPIGALGAGQSVTFTVNATGTTLGAQTLTATVTSPDTNPLTVMANATVTVSQTVSPPPASPPVLPPAPRTTPVGNLTLFGFGFGPTGIDLFEVDSVGDVFAVPFMGAAPTPLFLSNAPHFAISHLQDGALLSFLKIGTQNFLVDVIDPFTPFITPALIASLTA